MVSQSGSLTVSEVLRTAFPEVDAANAQSAVEMPVHIIPQSNEPRWIVLGDSKDAAMVLRSWRPFKIGTRLRWAGVVSASSLGILSRLPGVVRTRAAIDLSYWRASLPGFQDHWVPVLYIGNPSHTRKVTVFFVGRVDRRFKAVAKVPLQPLSGQAILNEAEVLEQLGGADFLPASLFKDPERGIAAQSWLEGEPVSRKLTPAHMNLLASFAIPGATIRVSAQRASVARELDRVDLPFNRDVLSRAQEMMDYDETLPAFIEHRDFAPWNLKRLPDGRTGAIDWEWAILRGLPCQDIFRYFYIQDALFFGPGDAWQRLIRRPLVQEHLRAFAIPPEALPALGIYYQLRVLTMDWQSGNTFLPQYAFQQIESLLKMNREKAVRT
jgi:hypothetical protein